MKQLNEYETPRTDERAYYSNDTQYGCGGYVVDREDAQHIERKLAMCRDALDFIRRNVWDQGGIIAKAADQALDQTK